MDKMQLYKNRLQAIIDLTEKELHRLELEKKKPDSQVSNRQIDICKVKLAQLKLALSLTEDLTQ
jgi:hypothetical protein